MDINGYVDRIESSIDDPTVLLGLRQDIAGDQALSDQDREFLDERISDYLADLGDAGIIDIEGLDAGTE